MSPLSTWPVWITRRYQPVRPLCTTSFGISRRFHRRPSFQHGARSCEICTTAVPISNVSPIATCVSVCPSIEKFSPNHPGTALVGLQLAAPERIVVHRNTRTRPYLDRRVRLDWPGRPRQGSQTRGGFVPRRDSCKSAAPRLSSREMRGRTDVEGRETRHHGRIDFMRRAVSRHGDEHERHEEILNTEARSRRLRWPQNRGQRARTHET